MIRSTGPEATNVFQDDQLCDGLNLVSDGAIHGVQYIWDANSPTEDWGLLLLDAKNAFSEFN